MVEIKEKENLDSNKHDSVDNKWEEQEIGWVACASKFCFFPGLVAGKLQRKWSWIFQFWIYNPVCSPRKQSKRKWKEKNFEVYADVAIHLTVYVAKNNILFWSLTT